MATTTAPQAEPPSAVLNTANTGLTDSTHTSASSSAERYRLDETDANPILLYKYRGSLKYSSQKDLCDELYKNENIRVTKKEIPRLSSYVHVLRQDLFLPEEKPQYENLPNFDSSLASIRIPLQAYWSRLFLGSYDNLYIVSTESSPASSQADQNSPRNISPSSSWTRDQDAWEGAAQAKQDAK